MPISFPMYSLNLGSDILQGLKAGQQFKQSMESFPFLKRQQEAEAEQSYQKSLQEAYATQKAKELAPFVTPEAQAQLEQAQALPEHTRMQTGLMGEQKKWFGPTAQSEIDARRAAAINEKFKRQNPLLQQTGLAGQIGAMIYLKQHPELNQAVGQSPGQMPAQTSSQGGILPGAQMGTPGPQALPALGSQQGGASTAPSSLVDILQKGIGQEQGAREARANYFKKMTEAYDYRLTTPSVKNQMLAQAAGMGYDGNEASSLFAKGHTLKELAENKGYNPDDSKTWPDPIFAQTGADITRIHIRGQAVEELNAINNAITTDFAPYARRFGGFSIKQIKDAYSKDPNDHDTLQHLLAARIIMPEMAGIRNRALTGAPMGVEMMEKIIEKSMGDIKIPGVTISPEDYTGAQNIAENYIIKAVGAANHAASMYAQTTQPKETSQFSEQDIQHTMTKYKLTREQVLEKLNANTKPQQQQIGGQNTGLEDKINQVQQQLEAMQMQQQGGEAY